MTPLPPDSPSTRELRAVLVPFISKRVDPQDVEDVVQNVFVRIQRGLADLRDTDKLLAWAYQIARNAIVDHARHAALRRHEAIERARGVSAPADEDDGDATRELARIVAHFIAMLPGPYRDALQMTELDGLTQAEAATRVGISLPGMKSRVQRGRAQLRELLEACCEIEQDTRGAIIEIEPRHAPASIPDCCSRTLASTAGDVRLQGHDEPTTNERADH